LLPALLLLATGLHLLVLRKWIIWWWLAVRVVVLLIHQNKQEVVVALVDLELALLWLLSLALHTL
jgi:hypothetical protein